MPTTILDPVDDTSKETFWRLANRYSLPVYVKQASRDAMKTADDLPTTAFADIVRRRLPCHTKAATWLSWMYFLESEMPEKDARMISQRLTNFANQWGIANDIEAMREKHAVAHRSTRDALPDSSFAIVWVDNEGRKERHMPMRNPTEVKVAAEWFRANRDSFRWDDRQTIATKLLEKAGQFGAGLDEDLDDLLEKQAGRGMCVPSQVVDMLRNRVRAAERVPTDVKEGFLKLATAVEANPRLVMDPTTTCGLARTVDQFDREYRLAGRYSAGVPRPEDVLFATTIKSAGQFVENACTLVTGTVYEKRQLSKLALSEVRAMLGDEIAQAVSDGMEVDAEKFAEVASTLPRPEARRLDSLMSDIGESPAAKNAQAVGASVEEQFAFAEVQDFLDNG